MQNYSQTKGDKIVLPKLSHMIIGLGWDPAQIGKSIDIDSACTTIGKATEVVYFNHRESEDGAVKHSGDNLTGEGAGDDEQIHIYVSELLHNTVVGQSRYQNTNFGVYHSHLYP
jgi:stress response protein SCP2